MESGGKTCVVKPSEFVNLDMSKKLILNIILPPLDSKFYVFRSFKIMPRAQNAHAYVNAAFLLKFNQDKTKVEAATVCFGGINPIVSTQILYINHELYCCYLFLVSLLMQLRLKTILLEKVSSVTKSFRQL